MPSDYRRVEQAIRYLESRRLAQPSLAEVARASSMSEFHFQRLFTRWAGVSPKRFLQFLTAEHARERLRESRASVLDVAYECGLSSAGRLHDLLVSVDAMTPGEVKARGGGLELGYGVAESPFGDCFVATSARGLVGLTFLGEGLTRAQALAELRERWPGARLAEAPRLAKTVAGQVFSAKQKGGGLKLLVAGSRFQLKVWEALLRIPSGHVVSYGDLARWIDAPRAARAVGSAVAENPIAYLIPCHRVIRESGVIGEYRWGTTRKKAILGWERSRVKL
ncbi:MAG: methylated-DNA--[protein]-cysteine S-methyltransferase [Deltaproteobacteria bacterium]|nr:methylated-DNA--[protein]-cysteine S-methyltransferase [Deltaproteobacteria bacterium]